MLTYILCLIMGALVPIAMAPFNLYTLGFICPAVLFYIWLKAKPMKALACGYLFGLGYYGTGISWVYIALHKFGNSSPLQSTLITLLMVLYLALYPAIQGFIVTKLWNKRSDAIKCLCILPVSWVFFEWLRSHLFTGFPWILLGYSTTVTPLKGLAPVIGIFGLSFVVALISGCLTLLARHTTYAIKILCIGIIGILIATGWYLEGHAYTKPFSQPLKVSLIQGNIPATLKWDSNKISNILNTYLKLTKQHLSSQLIIWPETAIPVPLQQAPDFYASLNQLAKANNTTIIFGAPTYLAKSQKIYNSLLVTGEPMQQYDKTHLVPFGEYTPLKPIFGFLFNSLDIPMSNISPGKAIQPNLKVDNINIAPFICYEIAFPGTVLKYSHQKQLIIVINDDTWYGRSLALAQHIQMAIMRALETQRYVLFCSNNGITAIISPFGIVTQIKPFIQGVLTQTIQPTQGVTPLMRFGYYPIWLICLLLLVIAFFKKENN